MQHYVQHLISKSGYLFILAIMLLMNCDPDLSFLQPREPEASVEEQLLTAYTTNSIDDYHSLIYRWHELSQAVPTNIVSDSVALEVYQIFIDFFDPYHIAKLTPGHSSTFWDSVYVNTDYFIIDNELVYTVYDTSQIDIFTALYLCGIQQRDTLSDFRPQVEFGDVKILYAFDEYMEAIYHFLGDNTVNVNRTECLRQQAFLNQYLKVIWPRWGGWVIQTMPEVSAISLNNTLDTAIVNWFRWDCGGKAIMQKDGEHWKFVTSEITWMTQ